MMTNPHKGEAEIEISGKVYTLRFGHGAVVSLENRLGKGFVKIMQEMDTPDQMRVGNIVALLWAGLQKHHPNVTMDQCCDLLDEFDGGAMAAYAIVGAAFAKAFDAPGTKGTNPPQAGNGTGTIYSSSTPATVMTPKPSGT
jgi:hypothetical protein